MKTNLKALSEKELVEFVERHGHRAYRARQLARWIYKKAATSFSEMTDLSSPFRELLSDIAYISSITLLSRQRSEDGTEKFVFGLEDGNIIESVLIPDKNRLTLCVSSQVGCALGCVFCLTGRMRLRRNLRAHEIVDQVIAVNRLIRQEHAWADDARRKKISYDITNIVLMGMGEPLSNFDQVVEALWRMVNLLGFSRKKITLSTAGIVPNIPRLVREGPRVNLAVSLNASSDAVRNRIMPINRRYPLKTLIGACRRFPLEPNRRITFEYVLLDGVNDSDEDAVRLARLLRGIRSKVNLIPYNQPVAEKYFSAFRRPPEERLQAFRNILSDSGITVMLRKSRGQDISAACGQLGSEAPRTTSR